MLRFFAFLVIAFLAVQPRPAEARKVALIVANSAYDSTSSLANPANDGALVAEALERVGFDSVTLAADADLAAFRAALRAFQDTARGAEVAIVYYAGHGIEGRGRNWLIPTDAALQADADLPYEAIDLELVLEATAGAQMRMVVLDACRNNPFANSWTAANRAVTRGLSRVEVDDVLIVYAAAPGQVAYDGDGDNSPFAVSLARRITQPALPVQMLGGMVRDDVLDATDGAQRPYISASVTGQPVYLSPPPEAGATAFAALLDAEDGPAADREADMHVDMQARGQADALAWRGTLMADTLPGYRAYLQDWPDGQFVTVAEANITRLLDPTLAGGGGERSSQRALLSIDGFLPYRQAVPRGDALPIDGLWTISTLNKRIRIEQGRAFAVDAWNHAVVLRIQQNMVVLTDMVRTGPGRYEADDLPLQNRARMTIAADGALDVVVGGGLFPARYRLIREGLDDPQGFAEEQAAMARE